MYISTKTYVAAAFSFVLILAGPSAVSAATNTVCASGCDFETIQSAITGSSNGDVLQLAAETYSVPDDASRIILNKELHLLGVSSATSIIECAASITANGCVTVQADHVTIENVFVKTLGVDTTERRVLDVAQKNAGVNPVLLYTDFSLLNSRLLATRRVGFVAGDGMTFQGNTIELLAGNRNALQITSISGTTLITGNTFDGGPAGQAAMLFEGTGAGPFYHDSIQIIDNTSASHSQFVVFNMNALSAMDILIQGNAIDHEARGGSSIILLGLLTTEGFDAMLIDQNTFTNTNINRLAVYVDYSFGGTFLPADSFIVLTDNTFAVATPWGKVTDTVDETYPIGFSEGAPEGMSLAKFDVSDTPPDPPPSSGGGSGLSTGSITVVKTVINDNGRTQTSEDFPVFIDGVEVESGVANFFSFANNTIPYTVSETSDVNYSASFSGDCDEDGLVYLDPAENAFCVITNNDIGEPVVPTPVPPLINVVKVPSPLSLPDGPGPVTYTYTVHNIGTEAVTDIALVGDTCSPITLVSGDVDDDDQLDVDETWVYTCSTTLSETHTNSVVVTGWANGLSAVDVASATVVVGPLVPPLVNLTKVPSVLTLPAEGGLVTFTEKISNPGTIPLTNVQLTDDTCAPMAYVSGDTNVDGNLDPTEVWTYTCHSDLRKTTTNTAVASGEANGITVRDFAIATVVVASFTDEQLGIARNEFGRRIAPLMDSTGISPITLLPERLSEVHAGQFIRGPGFQTVYLVTDTHTRRPFWNPTAFFTWADSFDEIVWVTDATLTSLPMASPVLPKPGVVLVKISSDPKVYHAQFTPDPNGYLLRWITSETIASSMFGERWSDYVIDLDPTIFSEYSVGPDILSPETVNRNFMKTRDQIDL